MIPAYLTSAVPGCSVGVEGGQHFLKTVLRNPRGSGTGKGRSWEIRSSSLWEIQNACKRIKGSDKSCRKRNLLLFPKLI